MRSENATAIFRRRAASIIRSAPHTALSTTKVRWRGILPNVVAGPDGTARAEMMTTYLHLNRDTDDSLFDADGSSLVLYEKPDDYQTDPEGGSGTRIGCGVIKAQ